MRKTTGAVLFAIFLLSSCATTGTEVYVPPGLDTYEGLASALDSRADILLYDVRTSEEYATGHIKGALNIPYDEINRRVSIFKKNRVIVVYCQSGGRSSRAYRALVDRGFTHVFDFGGIGNWKGELVEK